MAPQGRRSDADSAVLVVRGGSLCFVAGGPACIAADVLVGPEPRRGDVIGLPRKAEEAHVVVGVTGVGKRGIELYLDCFLAQRHPWIIVRGAADGPRNAGNDQATRPTSPRGTSVERAASRRPSAA